jgi:anti-sigma factor RsiW
MNIGPTMPDEDLLSAYLDGECTEEQRAWVEAQLESSPQLRAVLDDVRAARDAVRALPPRDAPPEFWSRILAPALVAFEAAAEAGSVAHAGRASIDLAARRRRKRARWLSAVGGAAAAGLLAAVVLVPRPQAVDPPVASFTDAHAVRASLQDDAVSSLAPLAVQAGFRR